MLAGELPAGRSSPSSGVGGVSEPPLASGRSVKSKWTSTAVNPQEYEALRSLLSQLVEIHGVNKDPEADLLIREAVARQPEATYLLVQRTLLLRAALDEARRRIAALSMQRQGSTSDPLWGFTSPPEAIAAAEAPTPPRVNFGLPLASRSSAAATVSSAPGGSGAAVPGFLGQAAATAAGVAGGAFLFQGVEDLLGHRGGELSAHDTALPAEDLTINNYYGSEPGDRREAALDRDADDLDVADTGDDFV